MKTRLQEIIEKEPKKHLTQEQKFRLRYGNDYMLILGSKYQNPLYNKWEMALIPEGFRK